MCEFYITIRSFQQVQEFVRLASLQPYEIRVGNEWQNINGKDLMGMFSLDYSKPVKVTAQCAQDTFAGFRTEAEALQS